MANHYERTNEAGVIILGFSDAFVQPLETDILVAEDAERHYNPVLTNERGQFLYHRMYGQRAERTQEELDAEWAARPPDPPSMEERQIAAEQAILAIMEALS
ncbi:hypothetical protein GXP70_18080 [Paenibacillus lycopersici]|uniref:Uncharacterized protein n=1 Tax=Paenibacillus lycopersici TaxID=2704462 RepID=A0A6C0G1D1_9BACL|nr:hypothetical protein [Paenibacillus lycopersici]QHT61693.1 hypothetical protein GXP70_18080 [Paenibacillus lycopersici]